MQEAPSAISWPVTRLPRQVRASLAERAPSHPDPSAPGPGSDEQVMLSLQIRLSPAQLNTCQAAADNASLSFQALEHAARHQLQPPPPEPAVTDAPPGSSRP